MNTNKRVIGLTTGAMLAAGAVTGAVLMANANDGPPAQASNTAEHQIADVAATDPQTGEKVYVDSESQVVKKLGEAGKLTVEGEQAPSFEITVRKVQALESCQLRGFGQQLEPENGTFLLLDISATLDASAAAAVDEDIALMPLDASVFGVSQGENENITYDLDTIASYSCEVPNALDIAVGAGDTVTGQLMLDSPFSSGQVIYDPEKTGGWTWGF
ncbi:hypothetical protein CQ019_06205 [Arthrobacter sp. MYb229]|uniref:hypothetical protein n=1 Tax=unclassified Arthrobacter TaxID=235627 RepID=UPI000CFAC7C3|nr:MULTISPECIES: hypothetical protein [unclassified Arthrobacter]PRA06938.1 hypothetical protein CQ019_06205 [Arthrobacter sp. MYb229]PRB47886.1 hypothetical protein CQ013_16000 [Arthrobacter sp. MYb216]